MRKTLVVMWTVAFLAACAETSKKYEAPQLLDDANVATINIYRTNVAFHSGRIERPFFYIDEMEVAKLGTGMAVTTKVAPGKHVLTVRESIVFMPAYENARIEHEFQAGRTYYVRYSEDFAGVVTTGSTATATGQTNFSLVDEGAYQGRK